MRQASAVKSESALELADIHFDFSNAQLTDESLIMKLTTSLPPEKLKKIAESLKKVPIELRMKVLRELDRQGKLARQERTMTSHAKDGAYQEWHLSMTQLTDH